MVYTILFYLLIALFVIAIIFCWLTNLFGLPGNWFNVAICTIWFLLIDSESHWHIGFWWIVLFVALAGIGELIEFGASVLGTKKVGGSRRAAVCSVIGSVVGGIGGGFIGLPFPIPGVGMIVGSVLFACVGAMVGGMVGEKWEGSEFDKSLKVGGAAAAGRFVGTMSKIAMGSAIVAICFLNLLF
ncbi:MAG: DUF456 domain-containing protein [Planctomycetota bacterium]